MQNNLGDDTLANELRTSEVNAKPPKDHEKKIMERINVAKWLKEFTELEVSSPYYVSKSLTQQPNLKEKKHV